MSVSKINKTMNKLIEAVENNNILEVEEILKQSTQEMLENRREVVTIQFVVAARLVLVCFKNYFCSRLVRIMYQSLYYLSIYEGRLLFLLSLTLFG